MWGGGVGVGVGIGGLSGTFLVDLLLVSLLMCMCIEGKTW